MSTKTKTIFLCTDCGDDFAKWAGQCPSCKTWGTLQEMSISENVGSEPSVSTNCSRIGFKSTNPYEFKKHFN